LVISVKTLVPSMDPYSAGAITFSKLLLYDQLVVLADDYGSIVPSVAKSWKIIADDTWRFELEKGIKFHNGEPLNAQAVKYSMDTVLESPAGTYYGAIKEAKVVDEYTVDIVTNGSFPALLGSLVTFCIVPPQAYGAGVESYVKNPVGSGPFVFKEFVLDSKLVVEANADYWKGPPKAKEVEFRATPDHTAAVAGLLAGEFDIVTNLDPTNIEKVKTSGYNVVSGRGFRWMFGFLRADQGGPLADKRVRQAINYAVDRKTIIETVFKGYAELMATVTTPEVFGHDPAIEPYPYDVTKAKELLDQAGYPDGKGINLVLEASSTRYLFDREAAEAIVQYLNDAGINTTLELPEWGVQLDRYFNRGIRDIHIIGSTSTTLDADRSVSYSLSTSNLNYWNTSEEVDEMITNARQEMDPETRARMYSDICKLFREEAAWLFLYQLHDIHGVNPRVRGFDQGAPYEYFNIRNVYVEQTSR